MPRRNPPRWRGVARRRPSRSSSPPPPIRWVRAWWPALARPSGNATGIGQLDSLAPKSLDAARDAAAHASGVGLVGDPGDPRFGSDRKALETQLGRGLTALPAQKPSSLDAALATLLKTRVEAIFAASSILCDQRDSVIELTLPAPLPVVRHSQRVCAGRRPVRLRRVAGRSDSFVGRRVVDKVLRGAPAGRSAGAAATVVELFVNLRTASTLGIAVPRTVCSRAEAVIE